MKCKMFESFFESGVFKILLQVFIAALLILGIYFGFISLFIRGIMDIGEAVFEPPFQATLLGKGVVKIIIGKIVTIATIYVSIFVLGIKILYKIDE